MIPLLAPVLANWRLIAGGAALAGAAALGWTANGWRLDRQIAALEAGHARQVEAAERGRADEERAQRAIEAARETSKQEIQNAASRARARADSDRRDADAAHERLLYAAAVAAGRASAACQDPGATGERQAATEPVQPLADVLGEASAFAGDMAAAADTARAAGLGCQVYVDALSK